MYELFKMDTYVEANETNSTNNRMNIYKCAYELFKEKPIFGYGIGEDTRALYNCYKNTIYYLYEKKFNTHNQYMSIVLKTGLFGLIVFLIFMGYNLGLGYFNKDWLFCSILIFYMILMLTENILERQNGVILFSFLINYISFKNIINYKNQT
jgi:O-antigen ligase